MRNVIKISGLMCIVAASMALGAAEPLSLSGVVTGPDGQPVQGAAVNAYRVGFTTETGAFDISHEAATTSDINGRFLLSVTPTPGAQVDQQVKMLFAEKEGYSIAFAYIMGHEDIQLQMTEPQTLSGRVEDARGVAVADALVQLPILSIPIGEISGDVRQVPTAIGFEPIPYVTTRTDVEGHFSFSNLPENCTAEIMVKKPGLAPFQSAIRMDSPQYGCTYTVGQDDIVLTLPDPLTLTGVVTGPDGQPIGDVTVVLSESDTFYSLTYTPVQTDADGVFTFTEVAPGSVSLSVSDSVWMSETVTVDVRRDTGVPLKVTQGSLLTVTVMDGVTESPIKDAHVQIILQGERPVMPQMGRTDEDGTYEKRLAPGTYQIHAYVPGYQSTRSVAAVVEDGEPSNITITLGPTARITGTVSDANGAPVATAEVFVLPISGNVRDAIQTTDENGQFTLGWEPERITWVQGEFYIAAIDKNNNRAVIESIYEDTTEIQLTLQPGRTITGKVIGPDNSPLAEADVSVQFHGSRWSSTLQGYAAKTDQDGIYRIDTVAPQQRYTLSIRGPAGYGTGSVSVDIDDHSNVVTVPDTALKLANLTVTGKVVDQDDNPLEGVNLHCYGTGQPSTNARTGADGKFVFDAVCEGDLTIQANYRKDGEYMYSNIRTEGGAQDVTIVLSPQSSGRQFVPRQPASLVGEPLPDLSGYGLELSTEVGPTLVCVWEWRQRPSRHMVQQLAERADELTGKSVHVVLLNGESTDREPLEAWLSDFDIPFPCGVISIDPDNARFNLGVRAMPWLILTDAERTVVAEGFALDELAIITNPNP